MSPLSILGVAGGIGMLTDTSCIFLHFLARLQLDGAT